MIQKDFFDSIGQSRKLAGSNGMSVLPPTADVVGSPPRVRFVPIVLKKSVFADD
jgi:hypothetical protein